jgi:hypothetical protein
MARTASRKMMKRTTKRTTKSSPKRVMRKTKRAAPMKSRQSTECSRLPASQCNAINPNCQAKKAPGRRTKICVRKSGAKKGMMYEGPSIV